MVCLFLSTTEVVFFFAGTHQRPSLLNEYNCEYVVERKNSRKTKERQTRHGCRLESDESDFDQNI